MSDLFLIWLVLAIIMFASCTIMAIIDYADCRKESLQFDMKGMLLAPVWPVVIPSALLYLLYKMYVYAFRSED